ncbi:RICIN domain-containing protein [Streptomyces sp. NPDC026206]|uniref:RICIN domain-containing protein n=1 Tax=Streptomyces sp. NPDC026206 TaxID=3157089 RepID=UPI0033FE5B45
MGIGLLAPGPAKADHIGLIIRSQSSGLVVDVVGGRPDSGQAVTIWQQSDAARNQQFDFVDAGGGRGYKIVARHSGKCLDVAGWSKADGGKIIQWDCHGGANQLWEFVDIGDPKSCPPGSGGCSENAVGYLIRSKHSGKCLDAGNADFPSPPKQGASLQQWACAGSTGDPFWVNQTWSWEVGRGHSSAYVEPRTLPPMPPEAKQMVDQITQARRDEARCADPSVRLDPRLSGVARKHSEDLAANYATLIDAYPRTDPKRGHIGSSNTMPVDRIRAEGFAPAQRPENWSYGTNQTFAQAMDNWLHHDEASNWGHRAAILDCTYRVLGVGKANGHNSRVYWTQNFALR